DLHHRGKSAGLWFGQQEVDMFRHDDIADNHEPVASACLFKYGEEPVAAPGGSQERKSVIARASDKVQVMSTVGAMQAAWHDKPHGTSSIASRPCKVRKDGAPTVPEREGKRLERVGHPPTREGPSA